MKSPDKEVNPKLNREETGKLAVLAHSEAARCFTEQRWGKAGEFYELAAKLCKTLDRTE